MPSEQEDAYTFGRVFLLEAILHSLNSGKLGVAEPLQVAKSALQKSDQDVSVEMDVIHELEAFLDDRFNGPLISSKTSSGKWLLSFKSK